MNIDGIGWAVEMDIGDVSKKSGFSVATLRYYEEMGLIASNDRKGLRRQYPAKVLENLSLIALAKEAGFQLDELSRFFKKQNGVLLFDRTVMKKKAVEIAQRIKRLEAARRGLLHASECRAPSHLECPKFLRLLSVATKKQIQKKKSRRS